VTSGKDVERLVTDFLDEVKKPAQMIKLDIPMNDPCTKKDY
jgi:hypothetical protein